MKQHRHKKRFLRVLKYSGLSLLILIGGGIIYFFQAIKMSPPEVNFKEVSDEDVACLAEDFYGLKNNRLRKNKEGLWELYIEGKPYERGYYAGKLTKELMRKQEKAFVEEIKKMIPSEAFLNRLKYLTSWFNRHMDEYVPKELLQEIYGISQSAPKEFEFVGEAYKRMLNYHAAHDIGHALEGFLKAGCTSFVVNHRKSADGHLLAGRNFDFYVGDQFAEEKIVTFMNPEKGHKFVEITWGGFIGTVSGMNLEGLCVTMNAGKSEIPFSSATPISLIAREILQYASTIEEAYSIAKRRKAFVSEALLITSAQDDAAAIIEITPKNCALYYPQTDLLMCANHFQSEELKNTELNQENINESSSMYRYKRLRELAASYDSMNCADVAAVLRDQKGKGGVAIGMGNEKNICQLIAHHSIIFRPDKRRFWISTSPWQLGKYICYDLDSVFAKFPGMKNNETLSEENLQIAPDTFLLSSDFKNFMRYRDEKKIVEKAVAEEKFSEKMGKIAEDLPQLNPNFYDAYRRCGDYFFAAKEFQKAEKYYRKALQKEIAWLGERRYIEKQLKKMRKEK
ncbi:MAG: peptidase C45 [Bacteroidia bacterium]|nr:MAG: peptidase C45 [Bacteroidia bacterium]